MKKRFIQIVAIAAVLLAVLAGCAQSGGNDAAPAESGKIIVKYGYQPGHAQAIIAQEKGLYAKYLGENVEVQLVKFQSGPSLITAITAGQLDLGQAGDQPVIQAKANNVDLKIIGKFLFSDKVNGLIVRPDSGITGIADLKGKKVGVTVGSTGQQLLYIYLKSVGLKPSDIQQVNLQPGDIVSSITFRNIDAAVTWEPYLTLTQQQGTAVQLADGTGYKSEIDVIFGRNAFLQAHPEIAQGILKAQYEAGQWIEQNREEALALVAKDAGLGVEVLRPIFDRVRVDDVNLTDEDLESIAQSIAFSVEYQLIPELFDVSDFVDTQYLADAGLRG
jgi:ABC transporter, substrate-binding protein, aliphatic sulfonates family